MQTIWFLLLSLHSIALQDATLTFIVDAPKDTPVDAAIHISGSHPALGNWSGAGLKLNRSDEGDWRGTVKLPVGRSFEYKITRGDWSTVEKNEHGIDIANRPFTVKEDQTVRIRVVRWADDGKSSKAAAPPPPRRSTKTGDLRTHAAFSSKLLGKTRDIVVYVPPEYDKDVDRRYPVLYMHDGQNLFDAANSFLRIEWQADEHAERLIKAGRIPPILIVGIDNTPDRLNEYTPDRDESRNMGGRGADYARFLVEEVKPFIDKTYRTKPGREHTGVAGASLGGLISLYICKEHTDKFSMCGVISPALQWNDRGLLRQIEKGDNAWMKRVRFWVDMGTAEGRQLDTFSKGVAWTRELVALFDRAGLVPGRDYYYQEVYEGEHNEAAWADRFDKVLLYFFAL